MHRLPLLAAPVVAALTHTSALLYLCVYLCGLAALLILIVLVSGVVLPAVWSHKPTRRHAAEIVLDKILLAVFRRPRSP